MSVLVIVQRKCTLAASPAASAVSHVKYAPRTVVHVRRNVAEVQN